MAEAKKSDYDSMTDEALAALSNTDDDALDFLLERYKNFTRLKALSYFLIGADREDIVQEGMIGLYKAIRDFNPQRLSSFKAFAELCITRQIITAIKTATRQKHIPLNSYVSLNKPVYGDEQDRFLIDILTRDSNVSDPEEMLLNQENRLDMEEQIKGLLSEFERSVLALYLQGRSYQEMSVELNKQIKSIDNALQRIKRKLEARLEI